MPKNINYSQRDAFENLSRQDSRDNSYHEQSKKFKLDPPHTELDETMDPASNRFDLYNDGKAQFKTLPGYLKQIISKQAKHFAILACRIQNNCIKIEELKDHVKKGTMPNYMKRQQQFIERFTEAETVSSLCNEFLSAETKRLEAQNVESKAQDAARYTTLDVSLKPFFDRIPALGDLGYDLHLIFECLIQESIGTMLAKSIQDQAIKTLKRERFLMKKEEGNAPALITNNEVKKLTKEIMNLKLKVKTQQKKKPKNVKGKPGQKKSGKPNQGARKSKNKKGNGNSKSTSASKK